MKRLGPNDIEFLETLHAVTSVYRTLLPSCMQRAGDRCAAARLCRTEREIQRGTMANPGHWQVVWVCDPDWIRANAEPPFLDLVRVALPSYGDPYPPKDITPPRRGHLRLLK